MKKYRLLQTLLMPGHLPIILPIGYEVNLKGDLYIGEGGWYFAKTGVENNKLHWEEVKPVEKERIEVNLRHHTYGGELVVETGRLISDEYFPAIKKAIEQVLNPEPSSKKEEVEDKPLFVTEDGEEIFDENDLLWVVNTAWVLFPKKAAQKMLWDEDVTLEGCYKYFSTRYSAEKYLIMNKPQFSISEINKIYPAPLHSPLHNEFEKQLINVAKSKTNNQ